MTPISLTAAGEDAGARLDAFLAQRLPALTRSAAVRLIEAGAVLVDGRTPPPRRPAGSSWRRSARDRKSVV